GKINNMNEIENVEFEKSDIFPIAKNKLGRPHSCPDCQNKQFTQSELQSHIKERRKK
ncbi:7855_t:CDS:1, partial [Gigaspora margarita]